MDYIDEFEADYLSNQHEDRFVSYEDDIGCRPTTCNLQILWQRQSVLEENKGRLENGQSIVRSNSSMSEI